jgi:hypothetical protein
LLVVVLLGSTASDSTAADAARAGLPDAKFKQ